MGQDDEHLVEVWEVRGKKEGAPVLEVGFGRPTVAGIDLNHMQDLYDDATR